MKTRIMYVCDFCDKEYRLPQYAIKCEEEHLGLTDKEYEEYRNLLHEEHTAYGIASTVVNEYTRTRCDNATKAVLDFQKRYGFTDNR